MVESGKVINLTDNRWFDVLQELCANEVLQEYISLPNKDSQKKMLDSLKSKVMNTLMDQNKRTRFNNEFGNSMSKDINSFCSTYFPDEILNQAVKYEGSSLTFIHVDRLKEELRSWGREKGKYESLLEHEKKSLAYKARFINVPTLSTLEHFNTLSTDATVTKTGSKRTDTRTLRKMMIKDLQLFETSKGCYLEGTLVGYARVLVGCTTLLEDDDGDVIQITLYNIIPHSPDKFYLAEKMVPHGSQIRIIEPFLKICRDGNRAIRVDDPSDICIMNREKPNIADIRKQGKEHMDCEEYLLAFEVYFNGIQSHANNIIPLLNNRSQTEIKLEQYEEALLDAAAVLLLKFDEKANQRYYHALQNLASNEDDKRSVNIWTRILQKNTFIDRCSNDKGSRETGNKLYAAGKYMDAKREYSSALVFPDICLLLTNVAIVCLQLGMFQTAISACSACLRISEGNERKQKAYYCMAKSFLMLRKPKLYKFVSSYLQSCVELDKLLYIINNCENIFHNTLSKCDPEDGFTISQIVEFYSKSYDLVSDFLQPETIEHVYIEGKGRGIKATRDIKKGELLLVDHPIVCEGVDINETKTFTRSFNFNTRLAYGVGDVNLATKLLTLVNYDGILAKKLLCLETRETGSGESLPLLDLNSFSYWNLCYDVLPFLPQTNVFVGTDIRKINEVFIQNILTINTFNHDSINKDSFCEGSALCLRISLFNHDNKFNCRILPLGKSLVIFAIKNIPKGSELTICYREDCKWKFNEP